jgi:hypothetical protein
LSFNQTQTQISDSNEILFFVFIGSYIVVMQRGKDGAAE